MLWSLKHVQARYRMLHYNNRLTWLITILFCAAPVWQACRCLLLLLVFLLHSHPDQYYHHWQRTITTSQFWICHSLLVTGDDGAFSVACELLTESSLCCLVVVRGGWSKRLLKRLQIVPEAALVTAQYEKKSFGRGKSSYWLSCSCEPRSQLFKASLEAFTGFHRKQLHPVTAPVRDELIGRQHWWRWQPVLFINETLSTQWCHYRCYTPFPKVLLIQV